MPTRAMAIFLGSLAVLGSVLFGGFRLYRWYRPSQLLPPPRPEVTLTIIPGWNLRQVAEYLVVNGFASTTDEVYVETGEPAVDWRLAAAYRVDPHEPRPFLEIPPYASTEGFLAPQTYRVFADASIRQIVGKLLEQRKEEVTAEMKTAAAKSGHSWYDILTMASIIEKEVKFDADRAKVADILWRRYARGWALQVDSSVHYAVDRSGDVFTTAEERAIDSPWNTYKYPGLPLGPIGNPGVASIKAALFPERNNFWYFLSGRDGKMYYAKTLEEHNRNKRHL